MIGTSTLFKHIHCPFDANCNRPFCYYEHEEDKIEAATVADNCTTTQQINSIQSSFNKSTDNECYQGYVSSPIHHVSDELSAHQNTFYFADAPENFEAAADVRNKKRQHIDRRNEVSKPMKKKKLAYIPTPIPVLNEENEKKSQITETIRKPKCFFLEPHSTKSSLPVDLASDELLNLKNTQDSAAESEHKLAKPEPKLAKSAKTDVKLAKSDKSEAEFSKPIKLSKKPAENAKPDRPPKVMGETESKIYLQRKNSTIANAIDNTKKPDLTQIKKSGVKLNLDTIFDDEVDKDDDIEVIKVVPSKTGEKKLNGEKNLAKNSSNLYSKESVIVVENSVRSTSQIREKFATQKPIQKRLILTPMEQMNMRAKEMQDLLKGQKHANSKTTTTTQEKGQRRVAHVPRLFDVNPTTSHSSSVTRPSMRDSLVPLNSTSNKIVVNIRQKHLRIIYDECSKYISPEESAGIAQNEEKKIVDRVSSKMGYLAAIPNLVKQLRNHGSAGTLQITFGSKSINDDRVDEHKLYQKLKNYLMSTTDLWENGYPRWVDARSKEKVEVRTSPSEHSKAAYIPDEILKRNCSRCGSQYNISIDGSNGPNVECIYHWGKAWKKRSSGTVELRYNCCDSISGTVRGCVIADHHITQSQRLSVLSTFVETPKPGNKEDPRSSKIYALDCEMVYTIWGPEVARLTVVDANEDTILDIIIKPDSKVVDCNTKFSGLTHDKVEASEYDLNEARKRFFELINSETILIGHSLESDLRSMRIVHCKVVDTAVIFPHRLGPPLKRALKSLASEVAGLIIQQDDGGHDSKEDAVACMRIMIRHSDLK